MGIAESEHWASMAGIAKQIETLGFESGWVFDHFHTVPAPTQEPTYEAWTLMAALAGATDSLRLGQMCTCNGYRLPTYLAKVASSLDVISGGRVEMGIGAGWYEHEFEAYGYGYPRAGVRLGQLKEAVEIMKAMWSEDEVWYDGKYYQVKGAINQPKSAQEGGIPLWVAGGGEKKTLRIAAEHADYTNFGGDPTGFAHKRDVLHAHCEDVGRDPSEITLSNLAHILIAETEAGVQKKVDWVLEKYKEYSPDDTEEKLRARLKCGTPDQIVESLKDLEQVGMGYLIAYFPEVAYDSTGLELFAAEVMPAFS
jgi:F420-dependent oxidoreductase-like protein